MGRNTGLKGYRLKVFERFPRTGIPDAFESLAEYDEYLRLLVKTGCIDNAKKIWWDIRLHPFFDTLEVRVCDAQSRVDDTLAIAALIQAVIAKLFKLQRQNLTFRIYRRRLIDENRWRASRYGLDCKMIDFGRESEVETRSLINELLEFVAPEVEKLGSQREMAHVESIVRDGPGADRQLAVYERTGDVKAVVDHIVAELTKGCRSSRQRPSCLLAKSRRASMSAILEPARPRAGKRDTQLAPLVTPVAQPVISRHVRHPVSRCQIVSPPTLLMLTRNSSRAHAMRFAIVSGSSRRSASQSLPMR